MDDDVRLLGEARLIEFAHLRIVGRVAEIDHHLCHIVEVAVCLGQQGLDILPHAAGLPDDVLRIHHLTFVVDRGGAGDKDVAAIGIVDQCATLERDAIVAGTVQMGWGIQIVYLLLLHASDGVVIHLRQDIGVLLTASDARRGDEVGVDRQSLCEEELVAGTYHSTVVQIDIVDEEPGADAVGLQGTALLDELHVILVEQQAGLVF